DNPLIVNVLQSLFLANNLNVYTCSNGAEGLTVLENKVVDVIVSDVMMPEMDGYAFYQAVRKNSEYSHIPFLFLTSLSSSNEMHFGQERGIDGYLIKPFQPAELLSVIKGKLQRSRELKIGSEERYDSYRKRVIHTLSHEFRTPLVAINTGTELLLEQSGNLEVGKIKNLLEAIQRGGQRLERLVNDFMLLQQIEAGVALRLFNNRASAKKFDDLVISFFESQRSWLQDEGFTYSIKSHCDGQQVKVYEPHILDIFQRLLSNAVKFSDTTKDIQIVAYPQERELLVEIRDRGIGLDEERIKEAIDVFGQIDRERLEQQGGGLGLAIATRYSYINQGRLEFSNRKDGGSVASFFLPLHEG
ncbi:MAG: hybrid sensor histidine kinase/response regulator, partial [Bdellovibrionales bacterium]|nr:hybrid sensor histidine kinase/response regulator [Bdellovibrionales bacterium]